MTLQRYEWEDLLIEAQDAGVLTNGALLLALKLSKAINWVPKKDKPAGLYWKNQDALDEVGASRAAFYDYKESLVETGFWTVVNGNILPTMPGESLVETIRSNRESKKQAREAKKQAKEAELQAEKSLVETEKSPVETRKSLVETPESLGHNPFTVDTLSEDTSTVDTSSENSAASPAPGLPKSQSPSLFVITSTDSPLLSLTEDGVGTTPLALVEDVEWIQDRERDAQKVEVEEVDELDELMNKYEKQAREYQTYNAEQWNQYRVIARQEYENGTYAQRAAGIAFGEVAV